MSNAKTAIGLAAVVAASAASAAFAQQDFDAPFPAHRMIGNIHFVGTEGLGTFLITTPDGHILINSDFERTVPQIRRGVEALGFEFEDIEIVLGSHAHGDHMEADALVKELTGARVMAMEADVPALRRMQPGGKPHPIDRELRDGDTVTLGGTTLTAELTPGHTKGCTTWTLEVEEAGQTYDAAIVCSFGVNANYVLLGNDDYPEIAADYERTFRKARALDVDVFLGAHGFWFDLAGKYEQLKDRAPGEPNPYVDPAGYRDHVDLQESRFRAMLEAQREAAERGSAQTVGELFEAFAADWMRADPDQAVASRYFEGEEQDRLERQLTPLTRAHALARVARARAGLADLARFDRARMTDAERIATETIEWQLETVVESEPFLDYEFPLEQMRGANVGLVNALAVTHPIAVARDVENYVARLELIDDRMREATVEAARRARLRIVPPTFILESTIAQMERFVAPPATDNALVTTLAEKAAGVGNLATRRRDALIRDASRLVETEVYPAWRAAIAELRAQLPQSTSAAGVLRFRNGDAIYANALARFTTTDLTADEIHAIGLREVARIETEMDTLLREVGLSEGSIQRRVTQLRERLAYPNDDAGRARIMSDIEGFLADAERRAVALFSRVPASPVIARPYAEFRWATAAASYTPAPLDGSRPAVFQMPLRPEELTRLGLRSLVYHETVPGHHYQVALVTETPEIPRFMRARVFGTISANVEGWALYAERLAAEAGWYEGDVEGRIGQLDSALFRARRLVVDTGLHAKGWTRQQAIDYGIGASEVERYVVWPGQACSYMIGQLTIVELRARAREALGDDFSIRDFHDFVLAQGYVPLVVLERAVERYLAAAASG